MSYRASRYPESPVEQSLDSALPATDRGFPLLLLGVGGGAAVWLAALAYVGLVGLRPDDARPAAARPVVDGPVRVAVAPAAVPAEKLEVRVFDNPRRKDEREIGEKSKRQAVPKGCATLNTGLVFLEDPVEAFAKAGRDGKLVFMVHVAGNFEDQAFT